VGDPFVPERLQLPLQMAGILVFRRRHMHHPAGRPIPLLITQQGSHQPLAIQPIRLRPFLTPIHFQRTGVQNAVVQTAGQQRSM